MKTKIHDRNICLLLFVNKFTSTIKCLDFKYYKGRIRHLDKNEYSRIGVVAILALFELTVLVFGSKEHVFFKLCECLPLLCYPLSFYLNFMWQEKRKIKFLIAFLRHLKVCQKISHKVYPFNCHLLISTVLKISTTICYLKFGAVVDCDSAMINLYQQIIVNILVLPGVIKLGGICLVLFYFEVQYSGLNASFENLVFQLNCNKFDLIPKYSWINQVDAKVVELLRVTRRLRRTFKLIVRFDELIEVYLRLNMIPAYVFLFDLYFRVYFIERNSSIGFYICCWSHFLSYIDFGVMAYYWRRLEAELEKTQGLAVALGVKHRGKLEIQMKMLLHHALIIRPQMAKFANLIYFYLMTWVSVILAIYMFKNRK